jgi:hypothetical protein
LLNLRPGCFHSAAGPVLFGRNDALPFTCLFTPVARTIEPIAADKVFIDCHYIVDEHGEFVPTFDSFIYTWHLGMFCKASAMPQYNNADAHGRPSIIFIPQRPQKVILRPFPGDSESLIPNDKFLCYLMLNLRL